jgi:hypothetical protein
LEPAVGTSLRQNFPAPGFRWWPHASETIDFIGFSSVGMVGIPQAKEKVLDKLTN